jgi:hypothetical protein
MRELRSAEQKASMMKGMRSCGAEDMTVTEQDFLCTEERKPGLLEIWDPGRILCFSGNCSRWSIGRAYGTTVEYAEGTKYISVPGDKRKANTF